MTNVTLSRSYLRKATDRLDVLALLLGSYFCADPKVISKELRRITAISKRLRKERELAFYGDEDFIPTEEYDLKDAKEAMKDANFIVKIVSSAMKFTIA